MDSMKVELLAGLRTRSEREWFALLPLMQRDTGHYRSLKNLYVMIHAAAGRNSATGKQDLPGSGFETIGPIYHLHWIHCSR